MAIRPLPAQEWNHRTAKHLLLRAGFGVPRSRIADLYVLGLDGAVDTLMRGFGHDEPVGPPDFIVPGMADRDVARIMADVDQDDQRVIGERARELDAMNRGLLKAWWMHRMATTTHPLRA